MDIFALTVGFLVGACTGAAGTYFGNKYTDQRRKIESKSDKDKEWEDLRRRFPAVLDEMMADVKNPESTGIRKFFVCESTWAINRSEPTFDYYTDKHTDLGAAIAHMEELGYIEDITPGNCPMFRIKETFYDRLKNG